MEYRRGKTHVFILGSHGVLRRASLVQHLPIIYMKRALSPPTALPPMTSAPTTAGGRPVLGSEVCPRWWTHQCKGSGNKVTVQTMCAKCTRDQASDVPPASALFGVGSSSLSAVLATPRLPAASSPGASFEAMLAGMSRPMPSTSLPAGSQRGGCQHPGCQNAAKYPSQAGGRRGEEGFCRQHGGGGRCQHLSVKALFPERCGSILWAARRVRSRSDLVRAHAIPL